MSRTLFCERAWLGHDVHDGVLLTIDGERITAIATGAACPAEAERLRGLTLPGCANAHSHAFHRALRSRTHSDGGTFWTWREEMYRACANLDPDTYYTLARATYAEMAQAGFTAVGEFHYLHHAPDGSAYADPNAMGNALIAAARDVGMRITLLDTIYLSGGMGAPLNATQRRFTDGDAASWARRVEGLAAADDVRIGAAIHSVRAVDPASAALVAQWARGHDAPLHAHVSEQPQENEDCLAAYGATPTAVLGAAGALSAHFTAVHATHALAADAMLLGAAGATVCLCPTTERDLADGIGAASGLVGAGVSVCIGTDSHAVIDPFEEVRAIELDERLQTLQRGNNDVLALLGAATSAGQRSLGWADAGTLRVGALADLICIDTESVRLAGHDPRRVLDAAVFAATAADVHEVIVGGRTIVHEGRHVSIDVAGELATSIAAVLP